MMSIRLSVYLSCLSAFGKPSKLKPWNKLCYLAWIPSSAVSCFTYTLMEFIWFCWLVHVCLTSKKHGHKMALYLTVMNDPLVKFCELKYFKTWMQLKKKEEIYHFVHVYMHILDVSCWIKSICYILPYSQSYPHDLPRMTSLSSTGGWMTSYTTCFARKVIMTSQANTPKRQRHTARFF